MSTWLSQHGQAFLLALRRLTASPVNTLLSLLAIGIALALPAGGQMLLANAMQLARNAAPTPQISLYLDLGADKRAVQEVEARLKSNPSVKSVRFIAREDTLTRMKASEGLGDVIDALPKNPFPDAFIVMPADDRPEAMEQLAAELRKLPKVEHVQLDSDWVRRLDALLKIGRTGILLLALLLGVGLVAITFNTIRLQVMASRAEIELSRLLGATDGFIRRPFHYFGVLLGLLGGLVAWLIVAGVVLWLKGPIGELAQLYSLDFALRPLALIDSLALLGAAATLGWLGAGLSLRQHLTDH
ncbi:MAG TPA: permease-like cell division protein FtsX [Rhodocyclaceae bacterium]|nr:permease-like cell division protein FtsX [Rhodocyclaceae bacterium]